MSKKFTPEIHKSIFQIRYNPVLSFYNKLDAQENIFNFFPHWQTDRLKVILRDYNKKHNLVIRHDSITYETDKYSKKNEKEVIDLIINNINNFITNESLNRLGHRFFTLIPLSMSFEDLVKIINLKFYNKLLIENLLSTPNDSSIILTSNIDGLKFRLQLGPIKKTEIPEFIKYNAENHIDPKTLEKYSELARIIDSYPQTALYFDLDLHTDKLKEYTIDKFYTESVASYDKIVDSISKYILEDKL